MVFAGGLLLSGSIPGPLRLTLSAGSVIGPGPSHSIGPLRMMMGLLGP